MNRNFNIIRPAHLKPRPDKFSLLAAHKLDERRVEGKVRSIIATRRMLIDTVLLITKTGKVIDIS